MSNNNEATTKKDIDNALATVDHLITNLRAAAQASNARSISPEDVARLIRNEVAVLESARETILEIQSAMRMLFEEHPPLLSTAPRAWSSEYPSDHGKASIEVAAVLEAAAKESESDGQSKDHRIFNSHAGESPFDEKAVGEVLNPKTGTWQPDNSNGNG
jgi:hypothetical protein